MAGGRAEGGRNAGGGVVAVVLAAGSSRRYGSGNKLLADIAGRPMIARTTAAFVQSRVGAVVVVTGADREAIERALAGLPIRLVHNPGHLAGMGGSIAAGVAAAGAACAGVMICPGDMPALSARLVDRVIDAFEAAGEKRIVHPRLPDGRQGHPVLWPCRFLSRLERLAGEEGAKGLLRELAGEVTSVPVEDADAGLDIDTSEDLERYRRRLRGLHGS